MALALDRFEQQCLQGHHGKALAWAMQLLKRVAEASDASRLIKVTQAHLVGSYYSGPADLALIGMLAKEQARVMIPTTLSSSSFDGQQALLYPPTHPESHLACELIEHYRHMGCDIALTCAPYHLPSEPKRGDHIAWAESNAVLYANSVIGARTNKTYQYMDLAAALTGRAPLAGLYLDSKRRGQRLYQLAGIPEHWYQDDSFYQLLGLVIGDDANSKIPVINGLPITTNKTTLRNLGAAAACSGNFAMFHAVGLSPEAGSEAQALHYQPPEQTIKLVAEDIVRAKRRLTTAISGNLTAVCMGTPHFSLEEFRQLITLLDKRVINPAITLYISTSRHVQQQLAAQPGYEILQQDNIHIVADTCTYYGQLIKNTRGVVMTCSAKWAYYAPGNLNTAVVFARMADCIESAIIGKVIEHDEFWSN